MGGIGWRPISQRVTVLRVTPSSWASLVCDQPRPVRMDLRSVDVMRLIVQG